MEANELLTNARRHMDALQTATANACTFLSEHCAELGIAEPAYSETQSALQKAIDGLEAKAVTAPAVGTSANVADLGEMEWKQVQEDPAMWWLRTPRYNHNIAHVLSEDDSFRWYVFGVGNKVIHGNDSTPAAAQQAAMQAARQAIADLPDAA